MSFPPPSAPPQSHVPQQQGYPQPTYSQPGPPQDLPPPYFATPPPQAAPLPPKEPYSSQAPYQGGQPGPYQQYQNVPQYQPPQPNFQYQPPPQTANSYPGYPQYGNQPAPQPGYPQYGYQPTPQPGYPQQGYQPSQPNFQPPPPQPNYHPPPSQPQSYGAPQLANQMAGMSLQGKAGDSAVLAPFAHGNTVLLTSCASGKSLRINQDGVVQGIGGRGAFAQFRVHVRRPGVVALQNVQNPENWLAIYQGKTLGTGTGDPFCDFILNEVEGRYVCLESSECPGQYVGILPDGTVKAPENTKTGQHGRFTASVHGAVTVAAPGGLLAFKDGNIVLLSSCSSGKFLRISENGRVEGRGGKGPFAQFRVHVRRPGVVALQNVQHPENWLAIYQGKTTGMGRGDVYCDLQLTEKEGQVVCLESVMYPGQHVGLLPDGRIKSPTKTRKSVHGQFTVSVSGIKSTTPTAEPKKPDLSPQKVLANFTDGNVVILQSNASGRSLRITSDCTVEGRGGRGRFAQFRVHVRRPGVVALQNVQNPENWLAIYQGKTIGTGKGGDFSEFRLTAIEGRFVCLESASSPGQYVGILPDGTVKAPENTRTGPHGRFIPSRV